MSGAYTIAQSGILFWGGTDGEVAAMTHAIESGVRNFLTWWMMVLAVVVFIGLVVGLILTSFAIKRTRTVSRVHKRFITEASHALRTPLSIMKMNIELSLGNKRALTKEEMIEALESTMQEVDRITRMTNTLLMLARLDERAHFFPMRNVNVTEILHRAIDRYTKAGVAKHIGIHVRADQTYTVRGNRETLETMFKQVIRNAIAYTPEYGDIWIEMRPIYPHKVEISITDTGIGIPRENLYRLFDPFYSAREHVQSLAKGHTGVALLKNPMGIGLTLAKKIAERHRGNIRAESEPGKGSAFFVTLPLT